MDNQNFYMRVLCLIVIVGAVVFYNSNAREKEYSQEIEELTERVDSLESQQEEMLTALQTWYDEQEEAAEEAKKAAEEAAKEAEEAAAAEEAAKEAEEAAAAEEAAKEAEEAAAAGEGSDSDTGEQDADGGNAGTEAAETSGAESETQASDADNVYQNGTFTGEGDGYGGKIQVQITIEDDTLTDVQILSASGEDVAYLSLGKTVIDSVLAEQSTEVDTVTGATFSSTGILIAIEDALGKAENG